MQSTKRDTSKASREIKLGAAPQPKRQAKLKNIVQVHARGLPDFVRAARRHAASEPARGRCHQSADLRAVL